MPSTQPWRDVPLIVDHRHIERLLGETLNRAIEESVDLASFWHGVAAYLEHAYRHHPQSSYPTHDHTTEWFHELTWCFLCGEMDTDVIRDEMGVFLEWLHPYVGMILQHFPHTPVIEIGAHWEETFNFTPVLLFRLGHVPDNWNPRQQQLPFT